MATATGCWQRKVSFGLVLVAQASPPADQLRRVPSDLDDSTAFAIRLATASGIAGSTAADASAAEPTDALSVAVLPDRKSTLGLTQMCKSRRHHVACSFSCYSRRKSRPGRGCRRLYSEAVVTNWRCSSTP